MGLNIHQYDIYMANNMINKKECTIVWYLDDNKISHVDETLTQVLSELEEHFGYLVISRREKHNFGE